MNPLLRWLHFPVSRKGQDDRDERGKSRIYIDQATEDPTSYAASQVKMFNVLKARDNV